MSIFTKKLINPHPDAFGLDLSDLSVKVMDIKSSRTHDNVRSFAQARIAPGAIRDGTIVKKEIVVQAIKNAFAKADIKTKYVVCSLPETKAFLRIITIPQMAKEEVGEAVKWEMEANIPMKIDQVYYDWQILHESITAEQGKMSILVVAIARTVVDQFVDVLQMAGLEPVSFEVESVAQARSLIAQTELQETVMIVDIGDRRTGFLIVVRDIPVFTSSIPLSSEAMTDAIAHTLNVAPEEAEQIKFAHGIGSIIKNDHIFHALQPVLESFITEINRSREFYLSSLRYSNTIDQIILCGGGARTKGIVPYFARRLQHDVKLGNPWQSVRLKGLPPIPHDQAIQYATTIGLAMKEY